MHLIVKFLINSSFRHKSVRTGFFVYVSTLQRIKVLKYKGYFTTLCAAMNPSSHYPNPLVQDKK